MILIKTGLPSFLITIGTLTILQGFAMELANSNSIPIYNKTFTQVFGNGKVFGIPVMILWCFLCMVIAYVLLRKLPFGSRTLAIGGNSRAAEYSGINVARMKLMVMMLSGVMAAFAGLQAANYVYGDGAEMNVIASVVLGGTAMSGGTASIIGTFVGAWLMAMIDNGTVIAGMTASQQMMVRGAVVIGATALGAISSMRKSKG